MRWSLRRGNRDADGQGNSTAPSVPAPAVDPGWRAVPPPRPSWAARAPLTGAPLEPRTPLTAEPPRRGTARPLATGAEPGPGRVVGLAGVRPLALDPVVPGGPPAPYGLDRPPLRHVPSRPLVEHPPLTEAAGAFVAEPVAPPAVPAPAPPAPGSEPPRPARPEPPVEAATEAGARFREALANLHRSGLPRYESPSGSGGRPTERPAAPPPSATVPSATVPSAGPAASAGPPPPEPTPRLTHRRNTLAQSRRLGLGAPLRRDGAEDGNGDPGDADLGEGDPGPDAPLQQPVPPAPPGPGPAPAAPAEAAPGPSPLVAARPNDDGGARPAATAAPLVFRARPAARVTTAPTSRPAERAVVTRAPAELARALRASHGVEVTDVPVHRDAAAAAEAHERRARAFTRGGQVFLPDAAGPVHSGPARGLLAHELVHVAQQRRFGSALPAEDTPEGRALEAEAQDAERRYGTDTFAEPPLLHAPAPVSAGWVEERITQHALDLPMPAGYPQILNGVNQGMLDEVRYTAQKIVTDALEDGSLTGAGAGGRTGGGRTPNVPLGVGIGNAQTLAEFQEQTLAALNAQRRAAHEREYADLGELTQQERDRIEARYDELFAQNRDAIVQSQMQVAVQQVASQQHGNLSWTPQGGFQRTGATPGAGPGATTGGPGPLPPGTAGTTPSRPGPTAATTAPLPAPTTAPEAAPDEGYDVGIGHAHSEQEFQEQMLVALNMGRPADDQLTWARLSDSDRSRITARWHELAGAQEQQAQARRFQNALRQQQAARRRGTAATLPVPTDTAPGGDMAPDTAVAAGTLLGAQAADARAAAEHTNDLATDSGITNTTAAGHPAISVDRIDMDDLAVRIWDRMRSRLRTELLVDRERAGLLTDFR